MKEIVLNTEKIKNIHCYVFDNVKNPKGVLQIVHGMQTHAGRYTHMAEFFCKNGYIVYSCDSKGHGKNVSNGEFAVGDKDLFLEIVADTINISKYLKNKYKLPVYIFGHSYGSFVVQNYMTKYKGYAKAILCGTRFTADVDVQLGYLAIGVVDILCLKDRKLAHLEKLGNQIFGQNFKDKNWLTRDEAVYKTFKEDKLCSNPCPISFYRSMFYNMKNNYKNIKNQNKNKAVLIVVGSKDPVAINGKSARKLNDFYLKNDIDSRIKIYKGARHELFGETNKQEVFEDILNFINE